MWYVIDYFVLVLDNIIMLIFLFFKIYAINKAANLSQFANTHFTNAKTKYIKLSFNVNLSKKWNIVVKLYALCCMVLLCYLQLSVLSIWLLFGSFFTILPINKQILCAHIIFFILLCASTYWEKRQEEKGSNSRSAAKNMTKEGVGKANGSQSSVTAKQPTAGAPIPVSNQSVVKSQLHNRESASGGFSQGRSRFVHSAQEEATATRINNSTQHDHSVSRHGFSTNFASESRSFSQDGRSFGGSTHAVSSQHTTNRTKIEEVTLHSFGESAAHDGSTRCFAQEGNASAVLTQAVTRPNVSASAVLTQAATGPNPFGLHVLHEDSRISQSVDSANEQVSGPAMFE